MDSTVITWVQNFLFDMHPGTQLIRILLIILFSWALAELFSRMAVRALNTRFLETYRQIHQKRILTLQSLVRGAVKFLVYTVGVIVILFSLGIPGGSILTTLGLFSAGFGIGARPIISDYLSGLILIFEDQFAVGEKVELMEIIGVVEAVELRTIHLRATSGELYIIPNGDVRVVRNLSRGAFSLATIKVTIATPKLATALAVLEQVCNTTPAQLPDLIERPEYISEEGTISANVQLTLTAKAVYGRGARLRTRLMAIVTEALTKADVEIIS